MANYEIKGKTIYAYIEKLTEKEVKTLSKYVALGYTVEEKEEEETVKKSLKNADIIEFLGDDKEALDEYEKIKNTPVLDKNGKVKLTTKGKIVKKGFNAGRFWFCKTYPLNIEEVKKAIKEANRTELLEIAYKDYTENKESNEEKDIMTKDEYTRTYYWKYVY